MARGAMEVSVLRGAIDGSGDGYGYGSGYGDGSGSGDCSGYWKSAIEALIGQLPEAKQQRASILGAAGATIAYWRSDGNGTASNGGRNTPVAPGTVERELGPLRDECGAGQLHATLRPEKWRGDRWWICALIGDVRGDDDKYWALEREILGECLTRTQDV